jgi:phage RecT family recombinase
LPNKKERLRAALKESKNSSMDTNVTTKMSLVQKIEQAPAGQLANLPEVADRFKNIYTVMNGGNAERAAAKYEAEKFHFMKLIQDTPALQQCTKLSLYGCFLDMAVNGLSFETAMKHAYVVSFNTNVGTKQVPKWEKRATLMISGYGELHMRVRQGQIKYADNPIIVYEGDEFRHGTKEGKVFLEHMGAFPRKSDNIIACYIRLERNDGSVDYKVLSIEEIMKLKKFSKDPESKAWTDGLPGMVQAKTMKHAFRAYPKLRMGEFSQLQSKVVDAEHEELPVIDYGLNGSMPAPVTPQQGQVSPEKTGDKVTPEDIKNDDFMQEEPQPQTTGNGKRFDDDDF